MHTKEQHSKIDINNIFSFFTVSFKISCWLQATSSKLSVHKSKTFNYITTASNYCYEEEESLKNSIINVHPLQHSCACRVDSSTTVRYYKTIASNY